MKKIIAVVYLITLVLTITSCGLNTNDNVNNNLNNNSQNNSLNIFDEYEKKETEPLLFWVNFNTNGGSQIESVKTLLLTSAPEPTKKDHVFMGWYVDKQLTQAAIFPMEITYNRTLYAKWLKIKNQSKCKNATIKNLDNNLNSTAIYMISPNSFDMEELAKQGYNMTITITYSVYYKKDYDAPFDIGYFGGPKYDVYIYNSQKQGVSDEDIKPSTTPRERTIEITSTISDFKNNSWTLEFTTENLQNKIYFEDITVTYECNK